MEIIPLLKLLAFIFFILLSGFFSSSETAFTAANKIKIKNLSNQKNKSALVAEKLLNRPKRLLTGILIGNNLSNVAASALATAVAISFLESLGVTNLATSLTIVTVIMTVLLLIFGEITPKTVAIRNPEKTAMSYANILTMYLLIIRPVIIFFQFIINGLTKLFGLDSKSSSIFMTTDEIKTMVNIGTQEGVLEREEQEMIHSIIEFSDTIVREIMTPRPDVVCIDSKKTVADAIELIASKGHTRIPVFEDKIDNIIGIIYAKDLLMIGTDNLNATLHKYLRDAVFIPESKNIEQLFKQMKRARFHMAIIVDEYGGFSGIVTLEDIIEEIIGDIHDEYDLVKTPEYSKIDENTYLIEAGMNIDDFSTKLDLLIPENDDYDTLGGFVLSLFGKFPEKDESVTFQNMHITVNEIRKRRIITLKVKILPTENYSEVQSSEIH